MIDWDWVTNSYVITTSRFKTVCPCSNEIWRGDTIVFDPRDQEWVCEECYHDMMGEDR